jgi:hypothetical protein
MAKQQGENNRGDENSREEPLSDLNRRAGLRPDERDPDEPPGPPGSAAGGENAAGTPAGGAAAGGLGGSNFGDGSIDEPHIENALGAGIYDEPGDTEASRGPYTGPSGGAVGGTPAGKRAAGGNVHGGIDPDNATGADQTIGAKTTKSKRGRKRKTP